MENRATAATTAIATTALRPTLSILSMPQHTDREQESKVVDREDFLLTIAEYGFDAETVRRISENTSDMIDMPKGRYKFSIEDSLIEGRGVVASSPISPNETIGPARICGKRTVLGRYTNHAKAPNARMVMRDSGDVDLVAMGHIQAGAEITINYRQAAELPGAIRP